MSLPSTSGPSVRPCTLVAVMVFLVAMAAAGVAAYILIQRASASDAQSGAAAGDVVQQALRLGKPVVAEFGANNCESCREMKPVLARRFVAFEAWIPGRRTFALVLLAAGFWWGAPGLGLN